MKELHGALTDEPLASRESRQHIYRYSQLLAGAVDESKPPLLLDRERLLGFAPKRRALSTKYGWGSTDVMRLGNLPIAVGYKDGVIKKPILPFWQDRDLI